MRLADLNPKLEGTVENGLVRFDCPLGHGHKFRVPIHSGPAGELPEGDSRNAGRWIWHAEGQFPDSLTLNPSVDGSRRDPFHPTYEPCGWHGHITNGEMR